MDLTVQELHAALGFLDEMSIKGSDSVVHATIKAKLQQQLRERLDETGKLSALRDDKGAA